jgi:hypothetical protein
MSLLKINLSNKLFNPLMKSLVDLSYRMIEIEPQMYNYYLNKLTILTSTSRKTMPKANTLESNPDPCHNDIISIIWGSLLGNAQAEYLSFKQGTRVNFFQEGIHTEYILFLHRLFSQLGYCDNKLPKITTRLGAKGKIYKKVEFSTWSYTSFNRIYDL